LIENPFVGVKMACEYKKGDIVRLKSGGPKMVVDFVEEQYGETMVCCRWFVDEKKFMQERFHPDTIELVK
jgi:uncharacterized protein YodC (DUF2158 family)